MVIALPPATVAPPAVVPVTHATHTSSSPRGWTSYTVKDGDTLYGLAATFRTTARTLAVRNHITDGRRLWAGSTIEVPGRAGSTTPAAPRRSTRTSGTHTVRAGETLYDIAARYRTTVPAIAKANRISPRSFIFPGQTLRVSGAPSTGATSSAPAARGAAYTVRSGDTLLGIAIRHGRSVTSLVKANGLRGTVIFPGQRLTIPGAAARRTTPQADDTFLGVKYPHQVVANAARNRSVLASRTLPTRTQTRSIVSSTARRHGVDPRLALAISMQESGWNQRQVSVANAIGIMQVIPAGGDWASSLVGRDLDLLDPHDNATAGVVMLRALIRSTGSEDLAIASYYQGLGSVRSRGMYTDTKRYVATVKALKHTM